MITVQVKLFATLREHHPELGVGEPLAVSLAEGATVQHLVDMLKLPAIKLIFVNGAARKEDQPLKDGDIVAIFPPVGGG